MKRLALATFALVALAASAGAQVIPPGTNPVPAGGAYNSSPPTCVAGSACWLQVDANGQLKVVGSFSITQTTNAPVAPATATATNSTLVGCQDTSAAINPTTGQQSAINCDLNNNVLVSSGGAPNLAIAQVSIATSDTLAVAARALRRSVTIQNITGTQQVYCNQTTATTANGVLLPAVVGSSVILNTTSAVRCIAVTGAQTVAVVETY